MPKHQYLLYDTTGTVSARFASYEEYLTYFLNVLKPAGWGTRYVFTSCGPWNNYQIHLRLVRER